MVLLSRYPPQQRYLRRLIFDSLMKRESCITGLISLEGMKGWMKGREWNGGCKGGWKGGNVSVDEREGM